MAVGHSFHQKSLHSHSYFIHSFAFVISILTDLPVCHGFFKTVGHEKYFQFCFVFSQCSFMKYYTSGIQNVFLNCFLLIYCQFWSQSCNIWCLKARITNQSVSTRPLSEVYLSALGDFFGPKCTALGYISIKYTFSIYCFSCMIRIFSYKYVFALSNSPDFTKSISCVLLY